VLQCVAVCCSVLQCVAVCCSVLQYDRAASLQSIGPTGVPRAAYVVSVGGGRAACVESMSSHYIGLFWYYMGLFWYDVGLDL